MTDDRYPLRAVTGFNLSVHNTESALHALTDAGIPVVGGPITADEMENVRKNGKERFPGMARTVPTNTDQARALVRFNSAAGQKDSALVVDTRPNDTYNSSLAAAFRKAVSPRTKAKEFQSESPTAQGDVADQFYGLIDSICYSGARNVYFAGRPVHLRLFLLAMADRPCAGRKIQVITGSGASTVSLYLTGNDWKVLRDNPWLTLQYSAAGHPDMWRHGDFGADRGFYVGTAQGGAAPGKLMEDVSQEAAGLGSMLGTPMSWNDSRAMTAFDSVWLAANAVKSANTGRGASDALPGLVDVRRQWAYTYADRGVPGLTGWLCLDNDGNPYNKAVAIVTLDTAHRSVHFEGVAWPEGHPSANCDVPGDD
jgi:ABC-type branched-subunit amino acid transport system substrate-binding protein